MNYKERSRYFFGIFIVCAVLVFIAGLIAGYEFGDYNRFSDTKTINFSIVFLVWMSGGVIVDICYAVYAHIRNQEVQIHYLESIKNLLLRSDNKNSGSPSIKPIFSDNSNTYTKTSNSNFSLDEFVKRNGQ